MSRSLWVNHMGKYDALKQLVAGAATVATLLGPSAAYAADKPPEPSASEKPRAEECLNEQKALVKATNAGGIAFDTTGKEAGEAADKYVTCLEEHHAEVPKGAKNMAIKYRLSYKPYTPQ